MENTNSLLVLEDIEQHLKSRRMIEQFKGFLGEDTLYFINSVLITVEANEKLQKCTAESIGVAALQAATLRLSCLPQLKQAYMIPYMRRKKTATGWAVYTKPSSARTTWANTPWQCAPVSTPSLT